MADALSPATSEAAAAALAELAGQRPAPRVRIGGGRTKAGWARAPEPDRPMAELSTTGLDAIVEHNAGDFTVVAGAGLPLARLNEKLAEHGQMLALDPPLAAAPDNTPAATLGGILASNDSGPLRHRYGGMRDLVLGVTVALSDGTVARSGGKVIKNVAGYDLGKLFTGSLGTLGVVTQIALRLHPRPESTATVTGHGERSEVAAAAARLAALPLEAEALDVVQGTDGNAQLCVRFAGRAAAGRAERALEHLSALETSVTEDDEALWRELAALQRHPRGVVLNLAGTIGDLPTVLAAAAEHRATAISRAGLGLSWLATTEAEAAGRLAAALIDRVPGLTLRVQDNGSGAQIAGSTPPPAARTVEDRLRSLFDPAGLFR